MANEKGFHSKEFLIFKETVEGTTPAPIPKAYKFGLMTMDFNRNQRTEENIELGQNGEASKTDTGGSDPAGSMEVKFKADLFPILTHCILGEAVTKVTQSTAHATSTVYENEVDNVDGKANVVILSSKVLICIVSGTSDATDTALLAAVAGATDKDELTDGTVTWLYRDKAAVYDYDGVNKLELPSVGILIKDHTDEGAGADFERLGRGVFMQGMTLAKEGGNVIYKQSISTVMHGIISSTVASYVSPTITTEVIVEDNPYKRDDLCVTIGGVAPVQAPSFTMTIERGTTIEDGVACLEVQGVKVSEKISNTGTPKISGSLRVRMSKEEYQEAYENVDKAIVITYRRPTGEYAIFTLPLVQHLDPTIMYATDKPIELEIPLNAYGVGGVTNTVSYAVRSFLDW